MRTRTIEEVFTRQRVMMAKYDSISAANGMVPGNVIACPLNLDTKASQLRLKTMAWYITEEITEAMQCEAVKDRIMFLEELADIFHYFVEMMLMVDIPPSETLRVTPMPPFPFETSDDNKDLLWLDTIYQLGLAMNQLKNKPWKTQEIPLRSAELLKRFILLSYRAFLRACQAFGVSGMMLIEQYFRKSAIIDDRITKDAQRE